MSDREVSSVIFGSIVCYINAFIFFQESPERMDNGGSPDGDDRQSNRSDSRQGSDREGSHHSENGHSPRPAGRSRSRFVSLSRFRKFQFTDLPLTTIGARVILAGTAVVIAEAARAVAPDPERDSKFSKF